MKPAISNGNISSPAALKARFDPDDPRVRRLDDLHRIFPVRITEYYASLIRWRDPRDPLARQVVPDVAERVVEQDENPDPLDEARSTPVPGLVHRFASRALIKAASSCPIHCRFCFRRGMIGLNPDSHPGVTSQMLTWLRRNTGIREVILSGGDPLMLSDDRLESILISLKAIPHISLVRIHTRMPAALPERMHADLVNILRIHPALRVVAHFNHPGEATSAAMEACGRCVDAGIPVLSQSVLLRDVNDSPETLIALYMKLAVHRIQPYYLHLLDRAPGTSHFRVPLDRAKTILRIIRDNLPGYAVPRLVRDEPGRLSKRVMDSV